jgi:hypothetical protein
MFNKSKVTMWCLLILEHRTYWWRRLCICFSDANGSVSSRIFLLWFIVPMGGVFGFFCLFFLYYRCANSMIWFLILFYHPLLLFTLFSTISYDMISSNNCWYIFFSILNYEIVLRNSLLFWLTYLRLSTVTSICDTVYENLWKQLIAYMKAIWLYFLLRDINTSIFLRIFLKWWLINTPSVPFYLLF